MKHLLVLICCIASFSQFSGQTGKVRLPIDTVGFAHTSGQMDIVMTRILKQKSEILKQDWLNAGITDQTYFKTVIAPHDDYTYTGYLYPLALKNIKAKTVIIFGVAHKARNFKADNFLIFDSYSAWKGPYGDVKTSALREEIISLLPKNTYQVNDSMQATEHSVEAEIPFLQYYNKQVQIISILVPYMGFNKMDELAAHLGAAIGKTMKKNKLKWGEDVAIVISSDAVHYGDEQWGDKNFSFYGTDSLGYIHALEHEYEIMNTCLKDSLSPSKIKSFTEYTVQKENFKEYKWTWCGRYSVPLGLLTSYYLNRNMSLKPMKGTILGYNTSIGNAHIDVKDLKGMGTTAIATPRHWVGYAAIGFK